LLHLTAGLAPAPRQYVISRLIEAAEARPAAGASVDEAMLAELYARIIDELEVPLLESL
jgi:hypothetical protein